MYQDNQALLGQWAECVRYMSEHPGVTGRSRGFISLSEPQGLMGTTLLVAVPNDLTREFFQSRTMAPVLDEAVGRVFGAETLVAFVVDTELGVSAGEPEPRSVPSGGDPLPSVQQLEAERGGAVPVADQPVDLPQRDHPRPVPSALTDTMVSESPATRFPGLPPRRDPRAAPPLPTDGTATPTPNGSGTSPEDPEWDSSARLNPKYVFDSFVIGQSNRFAHAAAFAVAETPAKAYNPLFIYGDSGLGKTHLLHAIGHYAKRLYPKLRVRYVNSEEFTNDFINSIRDDEGSSFKGIYRNVTCC